jgi:hypothetical protein
MAQAVGVAQISRTATATQRQRQRQRRVTDGNFFIAQIMFFSHK